MSWKKYIYKDILHNYEDTHNKVYIILVFDTFILNIWGRVGSTLRCQRKEKGFDCASQYSQKTGNGYLPLSDPYYKGGLLSSWSSWLDEQISKILKDEGVDLIPDVLFSSDDDFSKETELVCVIQMDGHFDLGLSYLVDKVDGSFVFAHDKMGKVIKTINSRWRKL